MSGNLTTKPSRGLSPGRGKQSSAAKARHGGKREQRKVQTRFELLQAASKVFGKLGYAETRVEDIIEAAGTSRPTFYRFFSSKDALFDAVHELAGMSLLQMIAGAVAAAETPAERLEKGAEAYLRWLAATGPVTAVLRQEASRSSSPLYARRRGNLAMIRDLFDAEVFRAHGVHFDPLLFSSLLGAIESLGEELTADGKRVGEAEIQRGTKVIVRIFRSALSVPGERLPPIPER